MALCMKLLADEGFEVFDVHQEGRGFDLLARRKYEQRCVEVKGLQGGIEPGIMFESSEWLMAQQLREDYWIYVITDCATQPILFGVYQNPVESFGDNKRLIQRFQISATTLREALTP